MIYCYVFYRLQDIRSNPNVTMEVQLRKSEENNRTLLEKNNNLEKKNEELNIQIKDSCKQ